MTKVVRLKRKEYASEELTVIVFIDYGKDEMCPRKASPFTSFFYFNDRFFVYAEHVNKGKDMLDE